MFKKRNLLSREQAREKVLNETFDRTTVSFYRYVKIENPREFRDQLFDEWKSLGVLGRTYVSQEGINAQISIPDPQWEAFITNIEGKQELRDMPLKIAVEEKPASFIKLTIKLRDQIVADGLPHDSYDIENVGKHLTAREWNEAMERGATVVDMRNAYESRIGKFENALTPDVDTFREELPLVKDELKGKEGDEILLYCTGGVRCEKTSAYLKHHGFKNVNQLHGGIIDYKHQIDREGLENKFKGKNYVFDGRTEEQISDEVLTQCDLCGAGSDRMINCKNVMCNTLHVSCEKCGDLLEDTCSYQCNEIINLPEEKQKDLRKQQSPTDSIKYRTRVRPDLRPLSMGEKASLMVKKMFRKKEEQPIHERARFIGKVRHYFKKPQVVEFILEYGELESGDTLVIIGNTTKEYEAPIKQVRVDGKVAQKAVKGDLVTVKTGTYTRKNDRIYLLD